MTAITIPSAWDEPTYDVFCDPTALPGAGTGAGTSVSPYTDLDAALSALSAGQKLGIRTGRTLDVSSLVDMTATAALYSKNDTDNLTIGAWRPTGAPDTPSTFQSAKLIGTSASDWEEVDYKPNGIAGSTVAANNVYTLLAGSGVWHNTASSTFNASMVIRGVGYGARDSINDIVNESNYKQHSYQSKHVFVSWVKDSGTNAVVNATNSERVPFSQDMQWCYTRRGGLLVKSPSNPATRWGGVYVYHDQSAVLSITNSNTSSFQFAMQFQYCGRGLKISNTNDAQMTFEVYGLGASHCAMPWVYITDNLMPAFAGLNNGSIDMSAGTNKTVFGDGTAPWLTVDTHYIRLDHIYSQCLHSGWLKNCKWRDFTATMCNLQHGGVFFQVNAWAPYGSHNQLYRFTFDHIHCGVGQFGGNDWGIDIAIGSGGFAIHDFTIRDSAGGIQLDGARRNQTCYNGRFKRVVRAVHITDECNDGNGSQQVNGCAVTASDPAGWALNDRTSGIDWAKAVGINIDPDSGFPAKGGATDTDTMTKNDGLIFDNNRLLPGDCPIANWYPVRNGTVSDAHTAEGPWHAVGGVGTTANNGQIVTLNQQQVRAQLLATIGKLSVGTTADCLAANRVVDKNYADAIATQTVATLVTSTANTDTEDFISSTSPTTVKSGGTILSATTVDTDIDYTRVATNVTDMRRVPRWGGYASVGPIQYIPLAPATRALT